ncbi:MAG: PLP-dependent transferase [Bacteroidales bacterium]
MVDFKGIADAAGAYGACEPGDSASAIVPENSAKNQTYYFPMLAENDQYALAASQMAKSTGLFTIEADSTPEAIEAFCNSLTYWRMAVSWGGFESLVIPSCTFVRPGHFYSTLPPTLIRFSVGLEDAETLISDIDRNIHLSVKIKRPLAIHARP